MTGDDTSTERVWDAFLTPQDKELEAKKAFLPNVNEIGHRPVLLLVDLYRKAFGDRPQSVLEVMDDDSASSNLGLTGWAALPRIVALLEAARVAGIPVIHVTRQVELSNWNRLTDPSAVLTGAAAEAREADYAIVPELAPVPGEIVLRKRSASAFPTTALPAALNHLRADTVIVAGESTSGCVRATVVDGRDLRYTMVVPEECVFDRTEASHAMSLYDMHRKYAHVVPLDHALAYLADHRRTTEAAAAG
ncbi:cysteine hydrolase family protein [Nocardioides halotolerans]|uniref:cysteine hydrolase family protein n=1 Tax=Nocardioides halotolerans TaxID=433660 RepID=UPI00040D2A93|nr:isochorismatase family protein [Nocardioides halotolerans]